MLFYVVLFLLLSALLSPRDPNRCNFIGALVGGALGLIGARKDRKAQQQANEANRPVNQVAEWEAAGINPIFGISSGGYIPHQAAQIGDSYATAGARFGQALDMRKEQKLRETNLELENQRLSKHLDELANPSEPSHMDQYGGILPLPSFGGSRAGTQVSRQGVSLDGVRNDSPQIDVRRRLKIQTPLGAFETDPRWTPAEQIEAEYGEPVAFAYSVARAADIVSDHVTVPAVNAYSSHIGKPFADWMMSIGDSQARPQKVTVGDKWGGSLPRSIKPTQSEIDNHRYRRNVFGG